MSQTQEISRNRVAGGQQIRLQHHSETLQCDMIFGVFLPPQAESGPVPVLYWLCSRITTKVPKSRCNSCAVD